MRSEHRYLFIYSLLRQYAPAIYLSTLEQSAHIMVYVQLFTNVVDDKGARAPLCAVLSFYMETYTNSFNISCVKGMT